MEYRHDIHGCIVLQCGEDGPSGQRSMNRHAKPAERQKHKKHVWDTHSCIGAYAGTRRPWSIRFCCTGTTSRCTKKRRKTLEHLMKRWRSTVKNISLSRRGTVSRLQLLTISLLWTTIARNYPWRQRHLSTRLCQRPCMSLNKQGQTLVWTLHF